ncbi:MAG: transposase [Pseudobacteriovorax sp.]|nr:transposase [Pseudobacteriovorax sp.]
MTTRRRFTKAEKKQILNEHFDNGLSTSLLSRKHGIHAVTLYAWRRQSMSENKKPKNNIEDRLEEQLETENERLEAENKALKESIAEAHLERIVLKKALDLQLKKARRSRRSQLAKKLKQHNRKKSQQKS